MLGTGSAGSWKLAALGAESRRQDCTFKMKLERTWIKFGRLGGMPASSQPVTSQPANHTKHEALEATEAQ